MRLLHRLCVLSAAASMAFAGTGVASAGVTASAGSLLDAAFADMNTHTPGCVAGVLQEGDLVYANAFGMADLGLHVPMTTHTVLEIGSLSKQFTAASILLLGEEGKLSLDDPVRKYLPGFPSYGTEVTIRELLHHTSGVRDVISLMRASGIPTIDGATQADAIAMIERQGHLNFPPDTEYEYSNSGYVLLAAIVKRVSGEALPEFAAERIFRPLGMAHTFIDTDPRAVIPERARSFARRDDGDYRLAGSNWVQYGDGAVNTTVGDFARWLGNFAHPTIGGPQLIKALETRGRLADGQVISYAGGLFVDRYHGLKRIFHPGAWQGFRTYFELFPQRKLGLVTLCNGATTQPAARTARMADVLLPDLADTATVHHSSDGEAAGRLSGFAGYYASADHRTLWRVDVRHGKPLMGPVGGEVSDWSSGAATGQFVGSIATIRFQSRDGDRQLTIGEKGGILHRIPKESKADARGWAGRYRSKALQVTWQVLAKGDKLVLEAIGSNPNRLDTDHTYDLRPVVANVYAAGPYVVTFGSNRFWLFAGRASGTLFVRNRKPVARDPVEGHARQDTSRTKQ